MSYDCIKELIFYNNCRNLQSSDKLDRYEYKGSSVRKICDTTTLFRLPHAATGRESSLPLVIIRSSGQSQATTKQPLKVLSLRLSKQSSVQLIHRDTHCSVTGHTLTTLSVSCRSITNSLGNGDARHFSTCDSGVSQDRGGGTGNNYSPHKQLLCREFQKSFIPSRRAGFIR